MFRFNNGIGYALIVSIILISLIYTNKSYCGVPTVKVAVDKYDTKYDEYFMKYSKLYFGAQFNQRQFKAQAIAESGLNATVISPVGAIGIMQIMPKTWKELTSIGNITSPRQNISMGILYDSKLFNQQVAERPLNDRLNFTFASYNAGLGNLLKCQKLCNNDIYNCNLYNNVILYSTKVTTQKYTETLGYVIKINNLMK